MKEKCDMRKGYHSLSENSSASSTAVEDEEWNCGKSEEKSVSENDYEPAETSKKIKRGHKKFVTPKLVAALDRCQLSIRGIGGKTSTSIACISAANEHSPSM
ncbi:hypothetical protein Zmor_014925 [Zophobas morio]|uniref:Uncharacterized protein n=1 Tax=Zophobas morio TaxID=2755281 RepID=A0AA38ILM7_9CUCU|nr:hypothetical protein Zmor_014925 [Zophobas morio]